MPQARHAQQEKIDLEHSGGTKPDNEKQATIGSPPSLKTCKTNEHNRLEPWVRERHNPAG